jgi:hypothetical protein
MESIAEVEPTPIVVRVTLEEIEILEKRIVPTGSGETVLPL